MQLLGSAVFSCSPHKWRKWGHCDDVAKQAHENAKILCPADSGDITRVVQRKGPQQNPIPSRFPTELFRLFSASFTPLSCDGLQTTQLRRYPFLFAYFSFGRLDVFSSSVVCIFRSTESGIEKGAIISYILAIFPFHFIYQLPDRDLNTRGADPAFSLDSRHEGLRAA